MGDQVNVAALIAASDRNKAKLLKNSILSVVIPVLNEEDSLEAIVNRIESTRSALADVGLEGLEIIVVDDGSDDRTAKIAKGLNSVSLVCHERNRGYGAAIKTGFALAKGEYLAFLDADGTYPPEHFPALYQALVEEEADVVVGSRRSGAASRMPLMRRIGNLLWSSLVTLIGSRRCSDPASGMRILKRSALSRLYPLPDGLNFTPVMSTRCVHEELCVVEVPIPYDEREGKSKLTIVGDGTRFLKTILWTAMEYNPVKILGLLGLLCLVGAAVIGLSIVAMRIQGITSLGPWGVFSLFSALIFSVAGVSLYSLGVTFNYLVALFHRTPVRQGLFGGSVLGRSLEPHFAWVGGLAVLLGGGLALLSLGLGLNGWDIARLWLWLLGSALFAVVGVQLLVSWVVVRVLRELAQREASIANDLAGHVM